MNYQIDNRANKAILVAKKLPHAPMAKSVAININNLNSCVECASLKKVSKKKLNG